MSNVLTCYNIGPSVWVFYNNIKISIIDWDMVSKLGTVVLTIVL